MRKAFRLLSFIFLSWLSLWILDNFYVLWVEPILFYDQIVKNGFFVYSTPQKVFFLGPIFISWLLLTIKLKTKMFPKAN